jgi:hypothetical protein
MTVASATGGDLKEEFIAMRQKGHSYRSIGEHYGFSHERVRQIIGDDPRISPMRSSQVRRLDLGAKLKAYLLETGPVPRDELLTEFEITERQLTYITSHDQDFPRHLIILARRDTSTQYSDADVRESMQAIWGRLQEAEPGVEGMSHVLYDHYRDTDTDPSPALLIGRYGSWDRACDVGEVPHGVTFRAKNTYSSAWTDEALFAVLRRYVTDVSKRGERPSYGRYDRWQREHADAPSGTTIRNRGKLIGLGTWPDVIAAAMAAQPKGE